MRPITRKPAAAAGVAALAVALAACGGGGGTEDSGSGTGGAPQKGGTLILQDFRTNEHLDPQRTYVGKTIAVVNRMLSRTLTNFPAKEGAEASAELIPDAATDIGKGSDNNQTWTFTVRDDMKWEDGKAVTCEDFKYGVSRTFAVDQITSGPNYAIQWLDIPKDAEENSKYPGPYKASKAQQALYDKAVSCDGNKLTFKLSEPHGDFNQTVTMPAFAAIRKDKDTGGKYDFTPFSNGPYKLEGKYSEKKGGMFVRNENWDEKSDPIRKAYPDKIELRIGDPAETIAEELIADSGDAKNTVTTTDVPASHLSQVLNDPKVKERSKNLTNPYTDYFWVNVAKEKNEKVRQAMSMAIDKTKYVTANGGSALMEPSNGGTINPNLENAFEEYSPFGVGPKGDPAKAKKVLQEAGVKMPYPVTYTWGASPTQDKVAAGLKQDLEKAGFKVTFKKQPDDGSYYTNIQNPSYNKDVSIGWAGWGADWPSASTVVPALFTGAQVTKSNLGQNYSGFKDPDYDKRVKQNFSTSDPQTAEKNWAKLDQEVVKKGVIIPVAYQKAFVLHGSNVKGFILNGAYGTYVDLAVVAVK